MASGPEEIARIRPFTETYGKNFAIPLDFFDLCSVPFFMNFHCGGVNVTPFAV